MDAKFSFKCPTPNCDSTEFNTIETIEQESEVIAFHSENGKLIIDEPGDVIETFYDNCDIINYKCPKCKTEFTEQEIIDNLH